MSEMNIANVWGRWLAQLKLAIAPGWHVLLSGFVFVLSIVPTPAVYAQTNVVEQGTSSVSLRDINALPFMGPPSAVMLDQKFESLTQASGLDPATTKALQSIAGKQALWREIASYIRAQRSEILRRALARYASDARTGTSSQRQGGTGLPNIFLPLIHYASGIQYDLKTLELELQRIARSLKDDSELAVRLRKVLEQPGAVEAVYVAFIYPVYLASGGVPTIENMLVRNDQGKTIVGLQSRTKAKSVLDRLKPMLATVEQLTSKTIRDAVRIVDMDTLHQGFKEALSDPLTTAVTASLRMRRDPGMTAEQLHDVVTRKLNDKFSRSGDGIVLAKGFSRRKTEENLMLLHRLRAIAQSNATGLHALLGDFDTQDSFNRDFKAAMSTNLAAASLISEDAFRPVPDVFYKSSIFGSGLVKESGGNWSINPHRKREMALAIGYLEQHLRDYEEYSEILHSSAITWQANGAGERLAEFAVLQMAAIETLYDVDGLADRWIDEHFENEGKGYRALQGKASRIADIANSKLNAFSPLTINLAPGGYSNGHTHLLRSSAYLFFRSKFARDVYFNEFEDHYAARLWGIFDWNAQEANDPEAFRRALLKQKSFLRQIADTHEKVIIYVFHTPKWLSGSSDRHQVDGRPAYLLHSPKDYNAWQDFVRETVRFLKQHLTGVDVYYEVWNEPEIYWLEGNKEYLRLYAETVAAIKEEHPESKVGGAALNGWGGKAKGERGGDALNLELIRYTAKNSIPLDFISWHYFERPLSDLENAKKAYLAELKKFGVKSVPEFVVSEWSIPGRGSRNEPVAFAEYMLALYRSGVSIQTVAVWEEFTMLPRPQHLAPWGMLTFQGLKKPMFHVHTYFDRLSRNSNGIAVFESEDKRMKVVVSRKRDSSYELVMWESRYGRPLEAALETLQGAGLTAADLRQYGSIDQLENSIRAGKTLKRRHSVAFRNASEVYQNTRLDGNPVALHFAGAKRVRVTASEVVGVRSTGRQVFTSSNDLVANLPRGEVMWLRVEVD